MRVCMAKTTGLRSKICETRSSGPVCATRPQTADRHTGRVKRTGQMRAILPRIRVVGGTRDITVGVGESRRENVVVVPAAATTTAAVHTRTCTRVHTGVGKTNKYYNGEIGYAGPTTLRQRGRAEKKRARVRSMRRYNCVTLYSSNSSSNSSSARRTRHV